MVEIAWDIKVYLLIWLLTVLLVFGSHILSRPMALILMTLIKI